MATDYYFSMIIPASLLKTPYYVQYYAVKFEPFDYSLCADFTREFYEGQGYVILEKSETKDPRDWTEEERGIYGVLYGT